MALADTFQDAMLPLASDIDHGLNGSPVKVVVILAGLDEQMGLNVSLHLFHTGHEMIVTTIDFVGPLQPCRMRYT